MEAEVKTGIDGKNAKKILSRKHLLNEVKTYVIITIGLFINALGWSAFLIPSKIVGGGVAGIAALVFFATGLPVAVTLLAINAILILIAIKILGTSFGIKTIYSILVLSLFLAVMPYYIKEPVVSERFMAAILGGILCGVSVGLIFTRGGSTGGTDIIAMIANKFRNISQGKVILFCDVFIIASSWLVFRSLETIVYGYVTMGVTSYSIDLLLTGSKQSVQMFIISRESQAVADKIANEVGRGVTFLKGRGWYSNEDADIVMVVVRKRESQLVFRAVKEVDPDAFISSGSVMGVYGKGFDRLR